MEYREYYSYIFEDCDCLHEADCGCGQEEGYPWGGYKETESDFKDPRLQKMEEILAILEKKEQLHYLEIVIHLIILMLILPVIIYL